jgi:trehalose/maltose transport system substrate-binding protein
MLTIIQRVVAWGIRGLWAKWSKSSEMRTRVCIASLLMLLEGCTRPAVHAPVTLVLLDRESVSKPYLEEYQKELQEFTRETGILVNLLPSPESTDEQLALWQELLKTGASGPDLYGIDAIWAGVLNEDLIDLKPYFSNEISEDFPPVVAAYTVDDKLVAVPYRVELGLLYYRTDLLQQYGYRAPPRTWDELETMAARIQAGERAKGRKEFWGFVWQGADSEALTCDALEWQASEGGGQIIEKNKTISVNNAETVRAWQRAARWVGSISPPSVVAFKEWDAQNVWVAGDAAFMRGWTVAYAGSREAGVPIRDKFDVTLLPAGKAGRVGTLGGAGLAVSRFSTHPREALELVRYLISRDVRVKRSRVLTGPTTEPKLHEALLGSETNPDFALLTHAFTNNVISRPSNATDKKYEEVTHAYMHAVHSVLTGEETAPRAVAALEKELIRITGFKKGPPPRGNTTPEGKF